ncbi:hypothetical protein JMJ35_010112 [Cladonia borealis]|uniref:Uncharacterized protein n=1 Tax=Cladonia borealis TaxID=184061 RepID=A0AA39QTF5_9LECA|nr:hypothetical protein JMJ35_010112 [Cladonia borealis]
MSKLSETSPRTDRLRRRVRSDSRPESEYEDSESSTSSLQGADSSRSRRKRRRVERYASDLQARVKRLKPFYNDKYRVLLNSTVRDIASGGFSEVVPLPPNQIGVTIWSSEEKETFFSVLARRGRHDIKGIAADIGSKSESEVYTYLELLQNAIAEQNAHVHHKQLLTIDGIEPALEVSQQCCAALDLAAEAVSVLQHKEEEKTERQEHANLSLLTSTVAKWANRSLLAGEEGQQEVLQALPPATLLNLRCFLTLSKRIFMNSSIPENNWRTYAGRRQSPSITYTAFSDTHTLAISLTRKLIQSSLFFAMSRIRTLGTSGYHTPKQHVKARDVEAALNVLGMEANGRKTWIATARKCRLRVYENVRHRKVEGKRYSYDEVEATLSKDSFGSRGRYRSRSAGNEDVSNPPTDKSSASSAEDVPEESSSSSPDHSSTDKSDSSLSDDCISSTDLSSSSSSEQGSTKQRLEQAEDAYLEASDQKASKEEEKRLWEILGEDPSTKMDLEPIDLPPVPRRVNREKLVDWTTWIDYSAEWENFETPVEASSFAKNRRIGRRHGGDSGLADGLSEEDAVEERGRKALSDEFVQDSSDEGESQDVEYDDDSDGLDAGSNGRESRGISGEEMGDSMHASSPELDQQSIEGARQDEDEDVSGEENDDE